MSKINFVEPKTFLQDTLKVLNKKDPKALENPIVTDMSCVVAPKLTGLPQDHFFHSKKP